MNTANLGFSIVRLASKGFQASKPQFFPQNSVFRNPPESVVAQPKAPTEPEHIDKIIETYKTRKPAPRYSRCVEMKEIEKNDYNLNISRYISTAVDEAEIDLLATHAELVEIEAAIQKATRKHYGFLKELGLPALPPE